MADFVGEQGSSLIKSFLPVKEKYQKSAEPPVVKKAKQSEKKVMVNGKSCAKSSAKPAKIPYTRKHKKWSLKRKLMCHWCQKKKLQKPNAAMFLMAKSEVNRKIVRVIVGMNVLNATDGHGIFAHTSNN